MHGMIVLPARRGRATGLSPSGAELKHLLIFNMNLLCALFLSNFSTVLDIMPFESDIRSSALE